MYEFVQFSFKVKHKFVKDHSSLISASFADYNNCVRRRKNALSIRIGVDHIVWDNQGMNGSRDVYLSSPGDFGGGDDIITNLAKERVPGIEQTDSLVFDYY